jgi:hypothetical protein
MLFYETFANDRPVAAAAMETDQEISLGDEEQEEEEIGADAESRLEQVESDGPAESNESLEPDETLTSTREQVAVIKAN